MGGIEGDEDVGLGRVGRNSGKVREEEE